SWSAATRPRGTPRARWSASTPRGSGARPPTRTRYRWSPRTRSGRARPGSTGTRSRPSTDAGAGARRRSRTSRRRPGELRITERAETLEDLVAPRVARERVLHLGGGGSHEVFAVRPERQLQRGVPQRADQLAARDAFAVLADEGAVAHLGQRGTQIV